MTEAPINGHQDAHAYPVPTIIEFLLDETGSMSNHLSQTIGGYNDFLDEQRQGDGLCLVTLTKFDSLGLRTPYVDIDVQMVPNLSTSTFIPGSMTNLRDAIIARMDSLRDRLTQWDILPNVLFVAMTDGRDNTSNFSEDDVVSRLQEATAAGWTCVFLGANFDATGVGQRLGFQPGNIKSFATAEIRETMQELGRATTAFRASSAQTSDFFKSTTQGA